MPEVGIVSFHPILGKKWTSQITFAEATSLSCHPSGSVIAVGTTLGEVNILSTSDGSPISRLPISSESHIADVSYSPSGNTLAIGCGEGSLFILPVSDDGLGYHKISVLRVRLFLNLLQAVFDFYHFHRRGKIT